MRRQDRTFFFEAQDGRDDRCGEERIRTPGHFDLTHETSTSSTSVPANDLGWTNAIL
jgi:hypothetical protein